MFSSIIEALVKAFTLPMVLLAGVVSVAFTILIYPWIGPLDNHILAIAMLGIGIVVLLILSGIQKCWSSWRTRAS